MKFVVVGAAILFAILVILKFRGGDPVRSASDVSDSAKIEAASRSAVGSLVSEPSTMRKSGAQLIPPPFPNADSLKTLRDNPEVKKKLEENFRQGLEATHGEFISTLSPDLQDKFLDLLVSHRLGLGDHLVPGLPPPPVEKLMERDRAHEEELKRVLGEQSYGEFTEYKKTIPSRRDVAKLQERAANSGVPLTPEQKSAVLEMFTSERGNVLSKYGSKPFQSGRGKGEQSYGASNLSSDPAAMNEAFEADQTAADQAALSRAEEILSEPQADLLLDVLREKMGRKSPMVSRPSATPE